MNKITSEQLVKGIMSYLNTEIIPCIEDPFTKIVLKTMTITAESKMPAYKKVVDDLLTNPFVKELVEVDNTGTFEVETLIDSLRKAVNECGELTIKVPPVPLISPEEKVLGFNSTDISKLKQYLTNENRGGNK